MSRKVNNEAEFVYGSGQLNPRRSLSLVWPMMLMTLVISSSHDMMHGYNLQIKMVLVLAILFCSIS